MVAPVLRPVYRVRDWHGQPVRLLPVVEAAGTVAPAPAARRNKSRQSAKQDTGTAAAQQQARQNVDLVRRRIQGLTEQALDRVFRLYRAGGQELAAQVRAIIERYGGEAAWPAAAPLSAQLRAQRLQELLQQVDQAIQTMAAAAGDETTRAAMAAYRMGYYGAAWALDAVLPAGMAVRAPLLPHQAVAAATEYPYQGLTYLERYATQRPAVLLTMRRVIALSQLEGESVSGATSRFLRALGVPVGGPLPVAQRRQAAADALSVQPQRRGMTPRKHAELIVRTEISRSSAVAAEAMYDQNADVLAGKVWLAAHDRGVCPICQALDGTSYALDDAAAPTIPRHPRCVLPGQWIAIPQLQGATKSLYEGRVVEMTFRAGCHLAVTPNHPIATPRGWVAARNLRHGDAVFRYRARGRVQAPIDPDDEQGPALIEEVFSALWHTRGVTAAAVKVASEDFHGDAVAIKGDIDVVRADGLLVRELEARLAEPLSHHLFNRCDTTRVFSTDSLAAEILPGPRNPSLASMSRGDKAASLLGGSRSHANGHRFARTARPYPAGQQHTADFATADSIALSQGLCGSARPILRDHVHGGQRLVAPPQDNAMSAQEHRDALRPDPVGLRQFLDEHASFVGIDDIVAIHERFYRGHVYDLQDGIYSLYICNGVVVHNCRCSWAPQTRSFAELGLHGLAAAEPKPRQTYAEWAESRGIAPQEDGGLATQRAARSARKDTAIA